jgi:hypothetical protein
VIHTMLVTPTWACVTTCTAVALVNNLLLHGTSIAVQPWVSRVVPLLSCLGPKLRNARQRKEVQQLLEPLRPGLLLYRTSLQPEAGTYNRAL